MTSTDTAKPSLDVMDELDMWGLKYLTVKLALELDIFNVIAARHRTAGEIANAVRASLHGTRVILDALCALGLLKKTEGSYSLSPASETFLVRGGPADCADLYMTFWRDRERLLEAVRTGKATIDFLNPSAEGLWVNYAASQILSWPTLAETARERWAQVGITPESRPGLHVLDAACGVGITGFALAQADPTGRVTAFDLPKVLEVAARVADQMGVRQQVTLYRGSLVAGDFPPGPFDVVIFGAILYYFRPERVVAVLRKALGALTPAGQVVIRTWMADEERCRDENALLLAVEFLHDAPEGEMYTYSEYKTFLEAAGFGDVERRSDYLISATRK